MMSRALDPVVLQSFLEEVRGYLPALENEISRLRAGGTEPGTLNEIHRLAHSIRSASEMIGLIRLAEAARGVESLVAPAAFDEAEFDPGWLDELERSLEAMRLGLEQPATEAASDQDLEPPEDMLVAALAQPERAESASGMVEIPDVEVIAEDLVDTFSAEAEQLLDTLGHRLQQLRQRPADPGPALVDIRHAAHTLKGAALMVGLDTAATVAHRMEDVLDLLCSGALPPEPEILNLLVTTYDCLADLVTARGQNAPLRPRIVQLLGNYQDLMSLFETEDSVTRSPADAEREERILEKEDVDAFLVDTFLEEAESHLDVAGAALRELSSQPEDPEPALHSYRRAVHTIKGASGMVGLSATSNLARRLQLLLDRISERTLPYSAQIFEALSAGFDLLTDLVEAQGSNSGLIERVQSAYRHLDQLLSSETVPEADASPLEEVEAATAPAALPSPKEEAQQSVRVPLDRLAAVARVVGEIFLNASAFEQQIGGFRRDLDELSLNLARMRRLSGSLNDAELEGFSIQSSNPALPEEISASASEFDALEFDRYTRLHLLGRDLAEATNDLSTLSGQLQAMRSQFDSWIGRQRGLSGEAQDRLMRLRMVPLSSLANRLHRTVRVAADKTGKQVTLSLEGMATEFDKSVAEQLSAPLEHLLRNAVDHGIEPPNVRVAKGKPAAGGIRLEATHHGAHIVVRLSDDGTGINHERIRERAVQAGLVASEDAAALDADTLGQFIFEPGFSTAETISEISGRGVGLDIVRATVEGLKGRLTTHSKPGEGTTFTLLLPVSLAVARTMIVEAGGSRFAVPMASFTRALRMVNSEIEVRDGRPSVSVDGAWIPVLWLADWLGLASTRAREQRLTLLFVDNGDEEIAVAVDRVVEAREVVVKPLTGLLHKLNRFAGATILGDGCVVLIVNTSTLDPDPAVALPVAISSRAKPVHEVEILVVDDSLSIRRSVANLIHSAGWRATQARDGVEALEMLGRSAKKPDMIVMDIEMPRMDGYELLSRLRSQRKFDDVPIVMLTSRAGDKHRLKASSLGVDGYLTKPCPDEMLLAELRRWVGKKERSSQAAS